MLNSESAEEDIKASIVARSNRLGRLVDLGAPDFIVARELVLVSDAIIALFKKHKYDPSADPRASFKD